MFDDKKLDALALALAKKNGGTVVPARVREAALPLAEKDGKTVSLSAAAAAVYRAEFAIDGKKIARTPKGVAAARKRGLRFERIAVRTGLPLADVLALAEKGGVRNSYTGRGTRAGTGEAVSRSVARPPAS